MLAKKAKVRAVERPGRSAGQACRERPNCHATHTNDVIVTGDGRRRAS